MSPRPPSGRAAPAASAPFVGEAGTCVLAPGAAVCALRRAPAGSATARADLSLGQERLEAWGGTGRFSRSPHCAWPCASSRPQSGRGPAWPPGGRRAGPRGAAALPRPAPRRAARRPRTPSSAQASRGAVDSEDRLPGAGWGGSERHGDLPGSRRDFLNVLVTQLGNSQTQPKCPQVATLPVTPPARSRRGLPGGPAGAGTCCPRVGPSCGEGLGTGRRERGLGCREWDVLSGEATWVCPPWGVL